ncbi:HD domain-containing protein [Patescibacteria group bacterium]|nr:HD domain-containing protein [Patescibacteria group bacterium]
MDLHRYNDYIKIMRNYCQGFDEQAGGKNYRLYHQLRVAEAALKILKSGELSEASEKIVVLASLFHDIGKIAILKENNTNIFMYDEESMAKQKEHEAVGQKVLAELLSGLLTTQEITQIQQAIDSNVSDQERTPESKILSDADYLDELGVLNVYRMVTFAQFAHRDIQDTIRYWFEVDRTAKLAKVKNCYTPLAKREAQRRIKLQDRIMREMQNSGFNN